MTPIIAVQCWGLCTSCGQKVTMEMEFKIILKKNSEVVIMMEWDEIDEERADLIVIERLGEENVQTYSDKEVRNVNDEEELVVDEDDGWECNRIWVDCVVN